MKKILSSLILSSLVVSSVSAMSEGEKIYDAKCLPCHTKTRPSDMSQVVAPAIPGVMRHVKMNFSNEADGLKFIRSYVMNPDEKKSICMPAKLKKFGLMPSQKGAITQAELDIVSKWIYDNYPPKGFRGRGHGRGMR